MDRKDEIAKDWEFTCSRLEQLKMRGFAASTLGLYPFKMISFATNLVLVIAYGVLGDALLYHKREKCFQSKGESLGALMHASKTHLAWIDFDVVEEGRGLRNAIAHDGKEIERVQCWKYIDAIAANLQQWGIVKDHKKLTTGEEEGTIGLAE